MILSLSRRTVLTGTLLLAASVPTFAQDKSNLRFSAIFSDRDIRASMMQKLADSLADDFAFDLHYNGSLFKQGTELVALERGNLEMGNIAAQDFAKQVPEWSILTSAYLFRDVDHLNAFFHSEAGAEMKAMVEEKLKLHILGPTYFGTRQVGLRVDKRISTPADMAGVKLRMPGGDAWQFLGTALGANPVPMPVTGLSLPLLRMGGWRLSIDVRLPWQGQQWAACQ